MLSLWPYFCREALFPILVVTGLFLLPESSRPADALVFGLLLVIRYWRQRWLWRLGWAVREFHTQPGGRVVLHYAPVLQGGWDFSVLRQRCESELDYLANQFGFSLKGRVAVFLFSARTHVGKVFRDQFAGRALIPGRAIVLASDTNLEELLRHELAHLFSARWNIQAPPILAEGLSTWLQVSEGGLSIERAAGPFLRNRSLKLDRLLKSSFFFSEQYQHACYILAGSFTGFLIRRFGWDKYRKFYRRTSGTGFKRAFQKFFGMSLAEAECRWRNEWLAMEVLNQRMRRNLLAD